ncbi:hypothetical protein GEMRC1_010833 [Eukaryota sp. GEM-RC1]
MLYGRCSIFKVLKIETGAQFISINGTSNINNVIMSNSELVLNVSTIDFGLIHSINGSIELLTSESIGLLSKLNLHNSSISIRSSNISTLEITASYSFTTFNDSTRVDDLSIAEMSYSTLEISTFSNCSVTFVSLRNSSKFITHNSSFINFIDAKVYLHDSTRLMFNSGSNVVVSYLKLSLYDNATVDWEPNTFSNYSSGFCLLNLNDYSVFSANSKALIVVEQLVLNDFSTIVGSDEILVDQIFSSDSFWNFNGGRISENISITVNSHFLLESFNSKLFDDNSFVLLNDTGLMNDTTISIMSSLQFSSWSFVKIIGTSSTIKGDGLFQNLGHVSIESDESFIIDIEFLNCGSLDSNSPEVLFNSPVTFRGGASSFSNISEVYINDSFTLDQDSLFEGTNVHVSALANFLMIGVCTITNSLTIGPDSKFITSNATLTVSKLFLHQSELISINSNVHFDSVCTSNSSIELSDTTFELLSKSLFFNSSIVLQNSVALVPYIWINSSILIVDNSLFNASVISLDSSQLFCESTIRSQLVLQELFLSESLISLNNYDIFIDVLQQEFSSVELAADVIVHVSSSIIFSSDFSVSGQGKLILHSGFLHYDGTISLNEEITLLISTNSQVLIHGDNFVTISMGSSKIINYGNIYFENVMIVVLEPFVLNFGTINICNSSINFDGHGFTNYGHLISCLDDLSSITLSNGYVTLFEIYSKFTGSFIVNGSDLVIKCDLFSSSILLLSGQVHVLSSTKVYSDLIVDTDCPSLPLHDVDQSALNDYFWSNYCTCGLFIHSDVEISNITIFSGIVTINSSSLISELSLRSSTSILFIPSLSTPAIMPGPFFNKGIVVGSGTLYLDNGVFYNNSGECFNNLNNCKFSCADLKTCSECVFYPACGWSLDLNKCDSADNNQRPRFFKYSDWLVNDCASCQLFESTTKSDIQFSTERTNFNLITFSFNLPYVRGGQFWLIDFDLIDDVTKLSSCSNRVMPDFTNDLFSLDYDSVSSTAPHAEQLHALNNFQYFAYWNSNIWTIQASSCSQVSYTVTLSFAEFSYCQNVKSANSTVSREFDAILQTNIFFTHGFLTSQLFSFTNFSNFHNHYNFVSSLHVLNFALLTCNSRCTSKVYHSNAVFSSDGVVITFPEHLNINLLEILEGPTDCNFSTSSHEIVLPFDHSLIDLLGFFNFSTSNPSEFLSFTISASVLPSPINFESTKSLSISDSQFESIDVLNFSDYFDLHHFGPYSDNQEVFALLTTSDDVEEFSNFQLCDFNASCTSLSFQSFHNLIQKQLIKIVSFSHFNFQKSH